MAVDNKYFETGSIPYYLNQNSSAKDFSFNELTNPSYGMLDTLSKFILVEENTETLQPIIQEYLLIEDGV